MIYNSTPRSKHDENFVPITYNSALKECKPTPCSKHDENFVPITYNSELKKCEPMTEINDVINLRGTFKKMEHWPFVYSLTIHMMHKHNGAVKGGWCRDTLQNADINNSYAYNDIDMVFESGCGLFQMFEESAKKIFEYLYDALYYSIEIDFKHECNISYSSSFRQCVILVNKKIIAHYDLTIRGSDSSMCYDDAFINSTLDFAQNSFEFRINSSGMIYVITTIDKQIPKSILLEHYMHNNKQSALRVILKHSGFKKHDDIVINYIISEFIGSQIMNQFALIYTLHKQKPEMFTCHYVCDMAFSCHSHRVNYSEKKFQKRKMLDRIRKFNSRGYQILNAGNFSDLD